MCKTDRVFYGNWVTCETCAQDTKLRVLEVKYSCMIVPSFDTYELLVMKDEPLSLRQFRS